MGQSIALMDKLQKKEFGRHKELITDPYNSFILANFEWACDSCFEEKKALRAKPERQMSSGWPHLAYSDEDMVCSDCGKDFVFNKNEKHAWYEKYQFPIHSKPKACLTCRRKSRQLNYENKKLSQILEKKEENLSEEELLEVKDIFIKWNKTERANYYEALLRRKSKKNT